MPTIANDGLTSYPACRWRKEKLHHFGDVTRVPKPKRIALFKRRALVLGKFPYPALRHLCLNDAKNDCIKPNALLH